ncbi:MAG: penicillin-binding protein 2 [Acidobacteria bacterium]|nr:penicillin-binding protein 2 [Acidobacteriota bacterium]
MNRQIRRLGVAMLVLYGVLFAWLNVVQVLRADHYNKDPRNTRAVVRDFGRPRGQIISGDDPGVVLARSKDVGSHFGRARLYPEHDLFGHITGSYSFTFGSDGVEKSYNTDLTGRGPARSIKHLVDLLRDQETTDDVVLTVRKSVQQVAKAALGNRRGSVVAIDPRDGSILAMWSFPSYDPETVSQLDQNAARDRRNALLANPANPLLARSYRETFFPGSTFKVVTATAGLASGKVTPAQPVYPNLRELDLPDTKETLANFGNESCGGALFDVLRVSCNTSFGQMGLDIGGDALVSTAHGFGFGSVPPLDLPQATASTIADAGFFAHNRPLLAFTAIGQTTVRATPLQMALVAAAVANGGSVMAPHVMKEVHDVEGDVIRRFRPEVWTTAMSPEEASLLRDAMVGVVTNGTAGRLAVPGVPTAGKTGTAQIGNGSSHAWIMGFAPANAPRVAVAVIVENQRGASEATGGRVAAPIGRAVLEAALAVTK